MSMGLSDTSRQIRKCNTCQKPLPYLHNLPEDFYDCDECLQKKKIKLFKFYKEQIIMEPITTTKIRNNIKIPFNSSMYTLEFEEIENGGTNIANPDYIKITIRNTKTYSVLDECFIDFFDFKHAFQRFCNL